ncbi:MAG: allantoicase [Streptosporangiaceae bacterium]|nr:allantoicase [Streptosporangiaceae bacterium]
MLPDLLRLRGSVVAASDEFFAGKENLIKAAAPVFTPHSFGPRGQVYDGWETRRRRGPDGSTPDPAEHDWVVARFGAPGVVHAVVVDTAFFTGNAPQACSVQACFAGGYPSPAELADWAEIVPRTPLSGDNRHVFPVASRRRFSHVRLNIFPDGGVARLRAHGEVVPAPGMLDGLTFDVAALENGADVIACSDEFYSVPRNVISPGLPAAMGDGWETRRRRAPGHEWLIVRLAGQSVIRVAEIDTSWFRGNSPGHVSLETSDTVSLEAGESSEAGDGASWSELLPRVRTQPDTVHRFRVNGRPATHVRLSIYPDGGVARLRLYGSLTSDGFTALTRKWQQTA